MRGAREAPGGSCEAANHGVFFAQIAEVLEGELPSVAEAEGGARRARMRILLHLQIPHVMPKAETCWISLPKFRAGRLRKGEVPLREVDRLQCFPPPTK